jgi:hypothetical protein
MKRINKNLLIRLAFGTAVLLCSALMGSAQSPKPDEYPKVEVFVGYSALGEAGSRGISFGPNAAWSKLLCRDRDLRLRLSGTSVSISALRATSRPISIMSQPRVRLPLALLRARPPLRIFSSRRAFTIFWPARSLRRATAHASRHSRMCSPVSRTPAQLSRPQVQHNLLLKKSDNSFAMGLGGGLDIRASKRVSFRPMMDYNPVFVHDSTHFVRFSLGVLFHATFCVE